MQVETLLYFFEIAKGRTFLTVAEEYNISQSALSKALKRLEAELGFEILEKEGRSVRLSAEGTRIFNDLSAMESHFKKLQNDIRLMSAHNRAAIWLELPGNILQLKTSLSTFAKEHPEIALTVGRKIRMTPKLNSDVLENVSQEDFNMQLIHKPLSDFNNKSYDKLYDDVVCAIIPRTHPLAKKKDLLFSDLLDEKILINPWAEYFIQNIFAYTGKTFRNLTVVRLAREDLIYHAIEDNLITVFYTSDMYMLKNPQVVIRPIEDLPMQPIILYYQNEAALTKGERLLREHFLNHVRKYSISLEDCCDMSLIK